MVSATSAATPLTGHLISHLRARPRTRCRPPFLPPPLPTGQSYLHAEESDVEQRAFMPGRGAMLGCGPSCRGDEQRRAANLRIKGRSTAQGEEHRVGERACAQERSRARERIHAMEKSHAGQRLVLPGR
ncbi:hypothetical protein Droror1_Dr00026952, partial [Drosera rotundifolia]